jgi:signal transduction histidine kinase
MTINLPQFPVDEEERTATATDAISVPSEVTFAQEVRTDRLSLLWKVTLFVMFLMLWIAVVVTGGRETEIGNYLIPILVLSGGCMLTGQFLRRNLFEFAVWSYAMGAILGVGLMMALGTDFGEQYAPFLVPVLVFVVGLLLPVRSTIIMLAVVGGVMVLFPSLKEGEVILRTPTLVALILTACATGLSAQVSGELFAIAEWALENYRKERQTTYALFESRQALEKSLNRQRALTEQVQEANSQLESARRSEEEAKNFRGQFLANMSHELRTPLNAIIGFSQTMLDFPAMYDGVNLPEQYQQDMNQILSSGKHLLTIINDILDLSKVDAGKLDLELQPVDLAPVVKGVLSTAVGLVGDKGRRVQLLRDVPDPLPMVLGDPLRVRQVLLNLYSNAAKFTDSGYIKLRIMTEGNEVIFGVEDTGIGIADADRSTIFEEFRQGTAGRKKGRQGAGLGLAISQQLLRLMHGRIWFESVLGKGSTFFFALPRHIPEATEQKPETTQQPAAAPAAEVAADVVN